MGAGNFYFPAPVLYCSHRSSLKGAVLMYDLRAADFRRRAREVLAGKWTTAVLAGLAALLLGATDSGGPELNFTVQEEQVRLSLELAGRTIFSTGGHITSDTGALLSGMAGYFTAAALVMLAINLLLGSVVGLGYARFNLMLLDGEQPDIGILFGYLPHWVTALCARLWQLLYVFLWTLLFVIPGIVAGYSYAMTNYILAEHPDMAPRAAISLSKEMMRGNRWRLFCLHLSFIGWTILAALTMGIGNLWLTPYKQAATAAFYRSLTGGPSPIPDLAF